MDYTKLEKYEYKAPSYELKDRSVPDIDYAAHVEKRRFCFDENKGIYKSDAADKKSISMLFAGDLLCQENMIKQHATADGYDFSLCFEYIKPLLKSADLSVGNLETPVAHTAPLRGEIISHEGPFFCNAPVEYLEALSDAGFDMLTTENNHTLDAGVRGLFETIENTKRFGFIQTGTFAEETEKFVVLDVCGFKVGFVAFGCDLYNTMEKNLSAEGKDVLLNNYSFERACKIYKAMKAKGAEYIVCFPHWGKEYTDVLNKKQLNTANELTSIGYDFVVGSHSHVAQKLKFINDKPVVFSLGNLISHLNSLNKDTEYTILCHLKLTRDDGIIVPSIGFIPCQIMKNYNGIPFSVVPVCAQLGLSEERAPKLAGTAKCLQQRLGCKTSRMHIAYTPTEKAVAEFKKTEKEIPVRVNKLCKNKKVEKVEEIAIKIPDDKSGEQNFRYHIERNCLFKLFDSYAEMVEMGNQSSVVVIPALIENLPVKVVGSNGKPNNNTRLMYISNKLEVISDFAFQNYTKLESVRLFKEVRIIGKSAFEKCSNMTGIILPKAMEQVGSRAFADCVSLLSVKIPPSVSSIAPDAFVGCNKLVVYCQANSYADQYAREHNIPVKYMPFEQSSQAPETVQEKPVHTEPAEKNTLIDTATTNITAAISKAASLFDRRNKQGKGECEMTDLSSYTLQKIFDILELKLPDEYSYMANDPIPNMAFFKTEMMSDGGVLFLHGGDIKQLSQKVELAIKKKVKFVFADPTVLKYAPEVEQLPHFFIDNVIEAVIRLASGIRNDRKLCVVGITGSLGKTTTKDILHTVLKQELEVEKPTGNSNTIFSIFSLLQKLPPETKYLVQEYGASSPGLMEYTARACVPNAAIITNIAEVHIDAFGTKENILKEKQAIIEAMPDGCPAFLNYDDELLRTVRFDNHPVVFFSTKHKEADYYAENLVYYSDHMEFDIVRKNRRTSVRLNCCGEHNVGNAVVALAVAEWAGMDEENIVKGLAKHRNRGIRQNLTNIGGYKMYIDCYNNSAVSMLGAVDVVERIKLEEGGKRVAVISEMGMHGDRAIPLHTELAEKLAHSALDLILCFGQENAKYMADVIHKYDKPVLYTDNREQLNYWVERLITRKDITMYKGSNARMLHKTIDQVYGSSFHLAVNVDRYRLEDAGDYQFKVITEEDENYKSVAITKYSGTAAKPELPASYKGTDIFCIGPASFKKNMELREITIPAPIYNISANAFRACKQLERVTLPDTLKCIGSKAFRFCSALEEIVIPEGVIEIGDEAFIHCSSLKRVVLPSTVNNIGDNAFPKSSKIEFETVSGSYAEEYIKNR